MSRKNRKPTQEPRVVWSGRKGEPWDDMHFWNCGFPKCQEWVEVPNMLSAPPGRGQTRTLARAEAELAQHMADFHPPRKPRWWRNVYRWMVAAWRGVRAVAHWYLTSPVPPALGVIGIVGLLAILVIEGCA